jgi:hypothetical protein
VTRARINACLDTARRDLMGAKQLTCVQGAIRAIDMAQSWLNDKGTIVKNEYDTLLNKQPIETFTSDELIAEIRKRMFCGAAKA